VAKEFVRCKVIVIRTTNIQLTTKYQKVMVMTSIEKMIEAAFKEFLQIDCIEQSTWSSDSKLVFPTRRKEREARVSEQEMRFLFAKQLEKQDEFVYAVEVPTSQKYKFTGDGAPKIDNENGRSGNVDVCLYDKSDISHPVSLIEFKALNPKQSSYSKDFLKLLCDRERLTNYFVHIIKNSDDKTYDNIEDKYKCAARREEEQISQMKIFLCNIKRHTISVYEVVNREVQPKGSRTITV
jgi:hypothetical protein